MCVYGVLFLEIDEGKTPFDGVSYSGVFMGCFREKVLITVGVDSTMVC